MAIPLSTSFESMGDLASMAIPLSTSFESMGDPMVCYAPRRANHQLAIQEAAAERLCNLEAGRRAEAAHHLQQQQPFGELAD